MPRVHHRQGYLQRAFAAVLVSAVGVGTGFFAHYINNRTLAIVAWVFTAFSVVAGIVFVVLGWVYTMKVLFGGRKRSE
jgi:hypothetical protein